MAGYWPSSFFAFLNALKHDKLAQFFFSSFNPLQFWPRRVEVHKHAEKERGQYPAILIEQAWSIRDLLYGKKNKA